jgi:hypothetical protein
MDNELKKYIDRMNKYNQWEEEYKLKNKLTGEQKFKQYLELMELAYLMVPKERIEMFYQEKLSRLINERKMLLDGYKKFSEKIS